LDPVIILDIDDTLVDHSGAELRAASRFGRVHADRIPAFSESSFPAVWRRASERHIESFLAREISFQEQRRRRLRDIFGIPEMPAAEADTLFDEYLTMYENEWRLFPDVEEFLSIHASVRLGALSDGSQEQQEEKLSRLNIRRRFEFILTAESAGFSKPDPRLYAQACLAAGVDPGRACYIGDHLEKDARGAMAAGLRGVWLNRSGAPSEAGVEEVRLLTDFRLDR
jgi:putative hydrolase of the HAD superfamily